MIALTYQGRQYMALYEQATSILIKVREENQQQFVEARETVDGKERTGWRCIENIRFNIMSPQQCGYVNVEVGDFVYQL